VVTAGGLIGRVVDVNDERLLLEVADGVVVELLRLAISRRLDDSEAISDSVFGSPATSDTLEEAYAADDYVADDEAADPEAAADADAADPEADADAADPEAAADVEADPEADVAADGESTEVSEAGSASEGGSGSAPETVPPASAGGAAVPGVPVSPSTGVVGTDGTIQEAGPPAPRQDPH
jgi:hypothetical protein